MSTAHDAAERIREVVPILEVLSHYGYRVHLGVEDREQQFSCDLHGSTDRKPSARVYPHSNDWYCFACNKTRDAIATVQAKEGVAFWQAVKKLEKAFGLEPFQWTPKPIENAATLVHAVLDPAHTFEQDVERVRNYLQIRTEERDLPMETMLAFWEAFDKVVFRVRGPKGAGGEWTEQKGRQMLMALNAQVHETIREFWQGSAT